MFSNAFSRNAHHFSYLNIFPTFQVALIYYKFSFIWHVFYYLLYLLKTFILLFVFTKEWDCF